MIRKKKKFTFSIPKIRPIGMTGILRLDWSSHSICKIEGSVLGSIRIFGQRNRIELKQGAVFRGHLVIKGSDNVAIIGSDCNISAKIIIKGNNQTVSIGDKTTMGSGYIICQESCDVSIGCGCMISRDVEIRTTDAHSLVDRKTRQRVNQPASVVIGDHVWIGVGALVSKGSHIPEDSVVGAMSFVNKRFEENGIVLAGIPAKIVRRDVTWHRGRQQRFSKEKLNAWRALRVQDSQLTNE